MRRAREVIGRCAVGIVAVWGWCAAVADPPEVMDLAPADALVVVGAPSLSGLDRSAVRTLRAMGLEDVATPLEYLSDFGLDGGVDTDRGALVILVNEPLDQALPPVVALVPVTDFGAFVGGLGGEAGGGIAEVNVAGMPMFARSLDGGYAALGLVRATVEAFDAQGGNLGAHAIALGESGSSAVDGAELFITMSAEGLRTSMKDQVSYALAYVEAVIKRYGPDMRGRIREGVETALADATGIGIGLRSDAQGMRADVGLSFEPTSRLAQRTSARGDAHSVLESAPGGEFMLTYAVDTSAPTTKALLRDVMGLRENEETVGGPGLIGGLAEIDGHAGVIYPSSILSGVFSRGVYAYETADPAAFAAGFRARLEESAGTSEDRIETTVSYTEDVMTVSGVEVDSWSLRSTAMAGARRPPTYNGFVWGSQGGPNGHVAVMDNALYTSSATDAGLIEKAIVAARGGETAQRSRLIREAAGRLAGNRALEAYLNMREVAGMYNGFMGMVGMNRPVEVGENAPPVGVGVSLDGGGMRLSAYIPSEAVRATTEMFQRYDEHMNNRGGRGDGAAANGDEQE